MVIDSRMYFRNVTLTVLPFLVSGEAVLHDQRSLDILGGGLPY